jgi:hypothetical protein
MYDFEECYQCMRITNNDYPWMQVTVKIVDKCEACTIGKLYTHMFFFFFYQKRGSLIFFFFFFFYRLL